MAAHADPMAGSCELEPQTPAVGVAGAGHAEELGGKYRVVTFRVPLMHREKQLHFKIGKTVAEEEGCIKVKLAEDEAGNTFFMKLVLRRELDRGGHGEEVRRRINTELGVLKIIDHRHIIKLFQVFSSEDIVYVLMERVRTPLAQRMQAWGGKMTEEVARVYFKQLLDALSYLHGRGLVHRDLCLANVCIDEQVDMVKITSFGCSCLQSSRELLNDHPQVTDEEYAAPELLGGEAYHGKKADIWSLGCVLHAMLTGTPPWAKGTAPGDPAGLQGIAEASPGVRDAIQQMLNSKWNQRINLIDLQAHPWVTGQGAVTLRSTKSAEATPSNPELEASTHDALQKSFAKVGLLQLGATASSSAVEGGSAKEGGVSHGSMKSFSSVDSDPRKPRQDSLDSPDQGDVVDESFSPLNKGRRQRKFPTLLDTPLGAHKEIEPLWNEDQLAAGLGPGLLQLSPKAGDTSPSARTKRMLEIDILRPQGEQVEAGECDTSPMAAKVGTGPPMKKAGSSAGDMPCDPAALSVSALQPLAPLRPPADAAAN